MVEEWTNSCFWCWRQLQCKLECWITKAIMPCHLKRLRPLEVCLMFVETLNWNVYNFRSVSSQKRLSCLVARAAYHAGGNVSGVGKRFAHARFADTQLSRTCSLTPPSNRLSFTTRGSRRKLRLSRLWFRLLFCWGSLPVVPPLPRSHQRLAATNCLKFLTA